MSKTNSTLSDFATENSQNNNEDATSQNDDANGDGGPPNGGDHDLEGGDDSPICEFYHEKREEFSSEIDELGIDPLECGYGIEYLCRQYKSNALKGSTARNYVSHIRTFVNWLHSRKGICVEDVEYTDVEEFFEYRGELGRERSTLQSDYAAIEGVISHMELQERDGYEVSMKMEKYLDPGSYDSENGYEREPLTVEEVKSLISKLNCMRDKLMVLCGVELGPRSKDLREIEVDDVDFEEKSIELNNTKSGGTYVMPLTDNLANQLEYWVDCDRKSMIHDEENPFLFPSNSGGELSKSQFLSIVQKAAEEAGIQEVIAKIPLGGQQKEHCDVDYRKKYKVDIHVLRHTFSGFLKQYNVSRSAREYALDHSPDTTERYGKDDQACRDEIRDKFAQIDISEL